MYTFDCNYYCVNSVHVCSLSVVLLCFPMSYMLTEINKQTIKKKKHGMDNIQDWVQCLTTGRSANNELASSMLRTCTIFSSLGLGYHTWAISFKDVFFINI